MNFLFKPKGINLFEPKKVFNATKIIEKPRIRITETAKGIFLCIRVSTIQLLEKYKNKYIIIMTETAKNIILLINLIDLSREILGKIAWLNIPIGIFKTRIIFCAKS